MGPVMPGTPVGGTYVVVLEGDWLLSVGIVSLLLHATIVTPPGVLESNMFVAQLLTQAICLYSSTLTRLYVMKCKLMQLRTTN